MNIPEFVLQFCEIHENAEHIPRACYEPPTWPPIKNDAPTIMLFSAHPDDEVLSFAPLAMLFRERGSRIVNVAITIGKKEQHERRKRELQWACDFLGFELKIPSMYGFLSPRRKSRGSRKWKKNMKMLGEILSAEKPDVIITHHPRDGHPTHEGTSLLVRDVIEQKKWTGHFFEAEYWNEMRKPNLMVEISRTGLRTLKQALSYHAGEVERNPEYLAGLAAFFHNKVRLFEKVLGYGAEKPARRMEFAALFKRSKCYAGDIQPTAPTRRILRTTDDVESLL